MTGPDIFLTVLTSALTWCVATLILLVVYYVLNRYYPLRHELPEVAGMIDIDEEVIELHSDGGVKRGKWATQYGPETVDIIEFDVRDEYKYPNELFVASVVKDSGDAAIIILCDGDDDPRLGGLSVMDLRDYIGTGECMDVLYVLEHEHFLGMPHGSVKVDGEFQNCFWIELAGANEKDRIRGFTVWEVFPKAADHLRQFDGAVAKEVGATNAQTPDATV